MKKLKLWERKVKAAFYLRIAYVILTTAALAGVIAAKATESSFNENGFFITIVILISIFLSLQIYLIVRFISKINKYYSKIDKFNEAKKDPTILEDSKSLTNLVTNLDLETIDVIRSLKGKSKISIDDAKIALDKTKITLESVKVFISKYPDLKPVGIKDPKMLIRIYTKRIEGLEKCINNA